MKKSKNNSIEKPQLPITKRIIKDIRRHWQLYLLLLPGIISLVLFKLGPLAGMVIAFEDFSAFQGIFGSKWVGFKYFIQMAQDKYMLTLVSNTVILAVLSVVCVFPVPVLFSLFLNEIQWKKIRGAIQSLSFLPYFISAAVMVSIMYTILSPSSGIVNVIINKLGGQSINFMARPEWFRPIYIFLQIWQTFGYTAIIYIASIAGIDPTLYEAAEVDGANRWKKMWHITLPGIRGIVVLMMVLSLGNVLNAGFDQVFNLYTKAVYESGDILDTFIYRLGLIDAQYGAATAVGLFKSIISTIFISTSYYLAYKFSDYRIF